MNSRKQIALIGLSLAAIGLIATFQNCSPKLAMLTTQRPTEAKEKISTSDFADMINDSVKASEQTKKAIVPRRAPNANKRQRLTIEPPKSSGAENATSTYEFGDSKRNPQTYDAEKYQDRVIKENTDPDL